MRLISIVYGFSENQVMDYREPPTGGGGEGPVHLPAHLYGESLIRNRWLAAA